LDARRLARADLFTTEQQTASKPGGRKMTKLYVGSVTLILVLSAIGRAQTTGPVQTFFKQNIGLRESEIAQIDKGKAVAKIIQSSKPSQVFVFGATSIKAEPGAYVQLASDIDRLGSLPGYQAVRRISNPPAISDFSGFGVDSGDVDELRKCKLGDCDVQLPEENIQHFRSAIDWSRPDPVNQVNALAKKMALESLLAYEKGGNAALGTYRDKTAPAQVCEQFRSLLARSTILPEIFPVLYSYLLEYPKASLPGSSSVFYWEKVNFGLKSTLRINHQIAARMTGEHGPIDVIAIKQLYASHYFQTALDLSFCIPPTPDGGFYLITVKGSEQAGLTGPKGSLVRKVAVDKTRSSLEKSLQMIKMQLEK
jgi:hypothetical protein